MKIASRSTFRSLSALLGLGLMAVGARAGIVVVDPPDITIPTGGQGLGYYIDIATGQTTQDPNAPWVADDANFQLYRATGTIPTLRFAANNGSSLAAHSVDGWAGSTISGPFSLDPYTLVGPTTTFVTSNGVNAAGAYRQDRTGYLGIRFYNSITQQTDYGWMEIVTATTPAYSAVLTRWAYDDSGAPILTAATPEPASFVALGLGALALVRRRRRA